MKARHRSLTAGAVALAVLAASFGSTSAMASDMHQTDGVPVPTPVSVESQPVGAEFNSWSNLFVIYYSPGCGGGTRMYIDAFYTGQTWINDTFGFQPGGAGNGQRIRNNAASVRVYNADVKISSNSGLSYVDYNYAGYSACFNLNSQRNRNTNYLIYPAF